MSNLPALKRRSELIDDICAVVGNSLSRDEAITALGRAVTSWGCYSKSCFCIDWGRIECGQCEYDLFCCGVDDVVPYIRQDNCSCGRSDCWHRLKCFDIRCGMLYTEGNTSGYLRMEYYVEPPPILKTEIQLAKAYEAGDDSLWIEGTIDNLPPAGYIWMCDHWLSYQCYAQVRFDGPDSIDVRQSVAWINAEEGINAAVGAPRPGIDAREGVDLGLGIACGVHTVLSNLQPVCSTVAGQDRYDIGVSVELGVSARKQAHFDLLFNMALKYSYQSQMGSCSSQQDRSTAFELMKVYEEMTEKGLKMMHSPRPIKVNRNSIDDSSQRREFGKRRYGRGKRGHSRGHMAQRQTICCN